MQPPTGVNIPPEPPIISELLMKVNPIDPGLHANGLGFRCVIKNPQFFAPMCTFTKSIAADFPPMVCPVPKVSIDVKGQFCSAGRSYFSVDINHADEYQVDQLLNEFTPDVQQIPKDQNCKVDAGNSTKDKTRLICSGDPGTNLTVYALQFCSAPASSNPENKCLNGYEYDASKNLCVYKAPARGASACATGFTLSPLGCCAAAKDYPAVCPPGSIDDGTECISYSSFTHTINKDVDLLACVEKSGGSGVGTGPSGCTLSCNPGMYPNADCSACTGKP